MATRGSGGEGAVCAANKRKEGQAKSAGVSRSLLSWSRGAGRPQAKRSGGQRRLGPPLPTVLQSSRSFGKRGASACVRPQSNSHGRLARMTAAPSLPGCSCYSLGVRSASPRLASPCSLGRSNEAGRGWSSCSRRAALTATHRLQCRTALTRTEKGTNRFANLQESAARRFRPSSSACTVSCFVQPRGECVAGVAVVCVNDENDCVSRASVHSHSSAVTVVTQCGGGRDEREREASSRALGA